MDPADYTFFTVERREALAIATMDHPEELNAYRRDAVADIMRLPRDVAADEDVHALVLGGVGPAFTIGLHPDDYPVAGSPRGASFDSAKAELRAWVGLDKPVIVALNGVVQGAPLTWVLLADIVVAEAHARFRDFHVPAGLVAATGSLLWPMSAGLLRSKRYLYSGDWIDAAEAERIGIVTEVVPAGESLNRAIEWAERLLLFPSAALRYTKQAMNMWIERAMPEIFDPAIALEMLHWDEGVTNAGAPDGPRAHSSTVLRLKRRVPPPLAVRAPPHNIIPVDDDVIETTGHPDVEVAGHTP